MQLWEGPDPTVVIPLHASIIHLLLHTGSAWPPVGHPDPRNLLRGLDGQTGDSSKRATWGSEEETEMPRGAPTTTCEQP